MKEKEELNQSIYFKRYFDRDIGGGVNKNEMEIKPAHQKAPSKLLYKGRKSQ